MTLYYLFFNLVPISKGPCGLSCILPNGQLMFDFIVHYWKILAKYRVDIPMTFIANVSLYLKCYEEYKNNLFFNNTIYILILHHRKLKIKGKGMAM